MDCKLGVEAVRWVGAGGWPLRWRVGLLVCVAMAGCQRQMFHAAGTISSEGVALETWHRGLEGCSRDPWDGRSVAETSGVVSFFWEDESHGDTRLATKFVDAPIRLDFYHGEGGKMEARLQTLTSAGLRLDDQVCRQMEFETTEQPALYRSGRASLAGKVRFDCTTPKRHLTADFTFARCEY